MPLDPQAKALLDATPEMPDFNTLDLAAVRFGMGALLDRGGDAVEEACKALRNALGT